MRYFSDSQRHLVCWPYSVDNLHQMAEALGIARHWFHGGEKPHYDIPVRSLSQVAAQTTVVRPREIIAIIQGKDPPDAV